MTTLEDVANEVGRLDMPYITKLGERVRGYLGSGIVASVDYTPDNGTRYPLSFVPVAAQAILGAERTGQQGFDLVVVPPGFGGSPSDLYDVVTIIHHGHGTAWATRFDGHFLEANYVADKLGVTWADAVAIVALIAVVSDASSTIGVELPS